MNYIRKTANRNLTHCGLSENNITHPPLYICIQCLGTDHDSESRKTSAQTVDVVLKSRILVTNIACVYANTLYLVFMNLLQKL